MIWIVTADIDENEMERKARLHFIKEVSGDKYISWKKEQIFGCFEYYQCITNDGVNGVFITAHNFIVGWLCCLPEIAKRDFVVANTCIIMENADKGILQLMQSINSSAQLYYAKQECELIAGNVYKSNWITDVGTFGFKTSKSERIMYRKKKNGLMETICSAFDSVTL